MKPVKRFINKPGWPSYVWAAMLISFLINLGTLIWELTQPSLTALIQAAVLIWLGIVYRMGCRQHERRLQLDAIQKKVQEDIERLLRQAQGLPVPYTPAELSSAKKELEELYEEIDD